MYSGTGVLLMLPVWGTTSELWMRRMTDQLAGWIRAVAAYQPGAEWPAGVRVIRLDDRGAGGHAIGAAELLDVLAGPEIASALVHYIPLALRYREVWAAAGKRVFVHCHGFDVTWKLRRPTGERHFADDYPERVRGLADHVTFIANSHCTAGKLSDIGIPAGRIIVKHLGVPVPPVMPREHAGEEVLALYLGRLVDFKGPDLAIRAFMAACERGLRGRLVVAGDGPLRPACEQLIAGSPYRDRIELAGEIDEMRGQELRREAAIFTAHNRPGPDTGQEEAFGVSMIEAMAAGLPVVSGRSGSLEEVMGDEAGMLVSPGDVEGHAQALLRLAKSPALRQAMGEAGWRRCRQRFTIEREGGQLRQILMG
jgi:colanic acid/amylovoran biosynthesis glycosyltransferase